MFSGITAERGGYVRYWPLTDIGALRMSAFRGSWLDITFCDAKISALFLGIALRAENPFLMLACTKRMTLMRSKNNLVPVLATDATLNFRRQIVAGGRKWERGTRLASRTINCM
jgi:hypothetical protein